MTNFFEHQAAARRKTGLLVVYFVAALIGLVLSTFVLVNLIFFYAGKWDAEALHLLDPFLFAGVAIAVVLLVGTCSVYKVAQLSSGGKAVALMLGGRELSGASRAPEERRLLNVVEEMAIASGLPVPPVYVLDEDGINAFAAGYKPGDAVIGVSRGCLTYLSRDELQGVVAHEFSHILNGDMRLNIRLMGLVFGILALALIGQFIMRASSRSGSSSSKSDSKGRGQLVLLGLGLYVLGMVGAFFGNLIKAAVSRQREYLADASAVQFTRYPEGIGGALRKIGGLEKGPNLDHPNAPEASHMFFADALRAKRFADLLATHPPLRERIRRVLPHWDGTLPDVHPIGDRAADRRAAPKVSPLGAGMPTLPGMPQVPLPVLAEAADERGGTFSPRETAHAAAILDSVPEPVRAAAEEPFGARALVYGLLLAPDPAVREAQLGRLRTDAPEADVEATARLAGPLAGVPDAARLPLIDLALPALRKMSPGQYRAFRTLVDHLIRADQSISLFEFVLGSVLERHLDAAFGKRPAPLSTAGRASDVAIVLSRLAWDGHPTEAAARKAYGVALEHYWRGTAAPPMLSREACTVDRLDAALHALAGRSLGTRRRLLKACAAGIAADRQVTVREAELYRAIGDVLGCPIPPLPGTLADPA